MNKGLGIRDWGLEGKWEEEQGNWDVLIPNPQSLIPSARPCGFTLIELLVTIAIIGIMAGLVFGALMAARESGREAATKATIAKLNAIIMRRYESYMTRRVPIQIPPGTTPAVAAQMRLDAIRDIMRMEMPDAATDITNGPITFSWGSVPEPALHKLYATQSVATNLDSAQCLFKIISQGESASMEQFTESEIGTVTGQDLNGNTVTRQVFLDGWLMPIMWLRSAPGASSCTDPGFVKATGIHWTGFSDIQSGVAEPYPRLNPDGTPMLDGNGHPVIATADHDPFDTRNLQSDAFHLIPLIYSASGKRKSDGTPLYGIELGTGAFTGDPFANLNLGAPIAGQGAEGIITNHHIEAR